MENVLDLCGVYMRVGRKCINIFTPFMGLIFFIVYGLHMCLAIACVDVSS